MDVPRSAGCVSVDQAYCDPIYKARVIHTYVYVDQVLVVALCFIRVMHIINSLANPILH